VPTFEQRLVVMVRNIKAFLNLQAGVTRGEVVPEPLYAWGQGVADQTRQLEEAHRELTELRARLVRSSTGTSSGGVNPENVVWIFGTGRSGNTWLTSMMEGAGHAVWKEPAIGKLFGEFYYESRHSQRRNAKFVLGDPQKDVWLSSIRRFVLDGISGRFPELSGEDAYLVVKEQPGSIGAPLLMEALPESRMILLIRDPRDVVASWLDGGREGGWHRANVAKKAANEEGLRKFQNPTARVKQVAKHYLKNVGNAAEAYDAHQGPKVLVRYEELRSDALGTMKRIHSALGMAADGEKLRRAVEEHSWESIPEDQKGEGKFYRKATPGGWREDLTPEQVRVIEETTHPLLEKFYSYATQNEKPPGKSPLS
jgi:Sulfotransferase domain